MPRSITHADLVARALGALPPAERARVDAALEQDEDLRRRFETVAGHLLQYDGLAPAPPPPPFERIAVRLERPERPDLHVLRLQESCDGGRRGRRVAIFALVAAGLLLAVWGVGSWSDTDSARAVRLVAGRGLQVLRDGQPLSAPAGAARDVRAGDLLHCEHAAEARLGDRIRLVLDGGARLRIEDPEAVTLEGGRAWFEVAPGAFEVRTAFGPVRVLGTAFEVDVRVGALEVGVGHGRVAAGGKQIGAGERLAAGRVSAHPEAPGDWFRRPRLRLEASKGARLEHGRPLHLTLVFENPGQVPLHLPGPASARTAVWISFESPEGRVLGELPVREANVTAGAELLRPGSGLELPPGARRTVALRILPPVGSPRAYRCRALYRPEGRPGVLSTPLDLEVR